MKSKAATTLHANRPPLTEEDWNFSSDRVPDKQLVPCLLWEFLRESKTARQLAKDWIEFFTAAGVDAASRDDTSLLRRVWGLQFKLNHKLNMPAFVFHALGPAWGGRTLPDGPWQKLSPKTKQCLVELCEGVNRPVFIGTHEDAALLAAAARRASTDAYNKNEEAAPHLPARAMIPFTTPGTGYEALCVVVDWGRYDDNGIREGFEKLAQVVIKSRPKGIKPQVRKASGLGRKAEWRAKLNDLGLSRFSARHHARVLQREMPQAYKRIAQSLSHDASATDLEKKLNRARARFEASFRSILPFEKSPPVCLAWRKQAK